MQSAVAKSFAVLEALCARGPWRLSSLAGDLGLQKSTTHRVLTELVGLGYVEQDETSGLYRPTLRTWELGTAVVGELPVKQAAAGALHALHKETGETVSLTVRSGDDVLYLDKIISPRPVRFTTRIGSRVAAPLTAGGKAMLAHADDAAEVVARVATRPSVTASYNAERVLRDIATARRRGYAQSSSAAGVVSVGAAVLDRHGRPVAALSVSAPTARADAEHRASIIAAVMAAATTLSESAASS